MSLLILEGPDGAGKTTLAERLMADAGGDAGPKPMLSRQGAYLGEKRIAHHYALVVADAARDKARLTIMDRSWIAEPIYGTVMRGGACRVSDNERLWIERRALFECGGAVVLCLPPFEACREAWASRLDKEYPQKEQQLRDVWDGYAAWAFALPLSCMLPVAVYDRTVDSHQALLSRLVAKGWGDVP